MATDLSFVEFVADQIEEREWLSELITLTEAALPAPKPKRKRTAKAKKKSK